MMSHTHMNSFSGWCDRLFVFRWLPVTAAAAMDAAATGAIATAMDATAAQWSTRRNSQTLHRQRHQSRVGYQNSMHGHGGRVRGVHEKGLRKRCQQHRDVPAVLRSLRDDVQRQGFRGATTLRTIRRLRRLQPFGRSWKLRL